MNARLDLFSRLSAFFSDLRRVTIAEAADDIEPSPRFSLEWEAWLVRDRNRQQRRIEIDEAERLSTFPEDPAPFASEGLAPFLAWSGRQEGRRQARRRRVA